MDAEILADLTPCPERLLIAHPFQPVHMLPLVEVVRHQRTQEEAVSMTLALLEQLHRQVVVLNHSVPGLPGKPLRAGPVSGVHLPDRARDHHGGRH